MLLHIANHLQMLTIATFIILITNFIMMNHDSGLIIGITNVFAKICTPKTCLKSIHQLLCSLQWIKWKRAFIRKLKFAIIFFPLFLEKNYTALLTESFHIFVIYLKTCTQSSPRKFKFFANILHGRSSVY